MCALIPPGCRRPASSTKKKKRLGGRRKPLKTPIPDKEIQGNQSTFFGRIWPKMGLAWLDFVEFGVGFGKPNWHSTRRRRHLRRCGQFCAPKRTIRGNKVSTQFPNPG
jgi:hypothetical protein